MSGAGSTRALANVLRLTLQICSVVFIHAGTANCKKLAQASCFNGLNTAACVLAVGGRLVVHTCASWGHPRHVYSTPILASLGSKHTHWSAVGAAGDFPVLTGHIAIKLTRKAVGCVFVEF